MDKGLKLGVFICDCGSALAKTVAFSEIKANLEKLADVTYVSIGHRLCSPEEQAEMVSTIPAKGINRVVIAACSPQLYEDEFRSVLEKAGLNPYLLSLANIREQCLSASPDREKATTKAMLQISRALNRARLLETVERADIPVSKDVLVVGGGIAGIEAAIQLSNLNLRATLIEKETGLGGELNRLATIHSPKVLPNDLLTSKLKQIAESKNIEALTSARLLALNGRAGDFVARIEKDGRENTRRFGAIIIATGHETHFPSQSYGFELSDKIVTHLQLETMLKSPVGIQQASRIGFILDIPDNHARTPTISALKNALLLKERFGSEVYILCRNLKVDGAGLERLYHDARNKGVIFIKFETPPKVSRTNGTVNIEVANALLGGTEMTIPCNLLVVEEKMVPSQGFETLRSMLDIGLGPGNFYQEDNIHLYPVNSTRKGIFFAGGCHQELDITQSLIDAGNAALGAYQFLSLGKVTVDVGRVTVDPGKCTLCLTCVRSCPHRAAQIDDTQRAAKIIDIACQACGICVVACPAKAIQFKDCSDKQILGELEVGEGYR